VNGSRRAWLRDVGIGATVYVVTSLPVFLGVYAGTTSGLIEHKGPVADFLHGFCHFDGGHFESIIHNGYQLERERGATVAFFPGYPLAIQAVRYLTGWPTRLAMITASNAALLGAFILLAAYLRVRCPEDTRLRFATLFLIGFWPVGFYFRMGYSESLFLLVLAVLLLGFAKRWPAGLLAAIAGALTGIRAVGVAASAAVLAHVLGDTARGSPVRRIVMAATLALVSCWGLLAFMAYQQTRFGTPFAFVNVQDNWVFYAPGPDDIPSKGVRLALLEPIWNAYIPGSPRFWGRYEEDAIPLLNLAFWNPILFVLAVLAVLLGWRRGWLSRDEAFLGLGLLLIPYLTRADELSMGSHARFASVVVPAFLVLGRLTARLPIGAMAVLYAGLAVSLLLCSAHFAARWPLC
jgi:hypothetical protein